MVIEEPLIKEEEQVVIEEPLIKEEEQVVIENIVHIVEEKLEIKEETKEDQIVENQTPIIKEDKDIIIVQPGKPFVEEQITEANQISNLLDPLINKENTEKPLKVKISDWFKNLWDCK